MEQSAARQIGFCASFILVVSVSAILAMVRVDLRQATPSHASRTDIQASLSRGDYRGAERNARALIATHARDPSSYDGDLLGAQDLLVEALLGAGEAADPMTLALAEAVLDARQRGDSSDRSGLAVSLHNLGDVHFQRGEYANAIALHTRGLDVRSGSTPLDERTIADSLERLAAAQMRVEQYEEARRNLEKAHAIRLARASAEPVKLATTLELMAWLDRYAGNYAAARSPLTEALTIRRRLTPEHPALVTTIEVQGDLSMLEGDIAAAQIAWEDALSLTQRTVGADHPLVSPLERRLAYGADVLGNRNEGRRHLEEALRVARRTRAACDPELIGLVDYSANSLVFDGDYVEARKRFEQTLEMSEKCLGLNNSNTATVVFNLALLASQMGDFKEAERLYDRAINVWSSRGSEDPYVAKGLDALAEVFENDNNLARARTLYERALALRRKIRPDHPDVAWTLTNLARVVAATGDVPLALQYVTDATRILSQNGRSVEPDHLARAVSQRGDIQALRGNYAMARDDFAEALALREGVFGSEHPLTSEARLKLAEADFVLGRYDEAIAGAERARENGLEHVKFTVRYLPERRALAYAARVTHGLGLELSLATAVPSARPSRFLDAVIRSRSIVLDELGSRNQVVTDARPEVAATLARLNTARQRFANLMLRSTGTDGTSPETTALLNDARREKEDAEQDLADRSASFESQLARGDIGLAQVRGGLPANSALVSVIRYDRTLISDNPRLRSTSVVPSYVAFVLRPGASEPAIVPLGAAATLDALITSWRLRMVEDIASPARSAGQESFETLGTQIRERIWDPLEPHVRGTTRVFVVPDGMLNVFPIGALPRQGGGYLVEGQPVIHYLSAERDVVRAEEPPKAANGLLAIGGPAFSDSSSFRSPPGSLEKPGSNEPLLRGPAAGCPSFQSFDFDALPGSGLEAETVARLWDQIDPVKRSGPDHSRLLTGRLATEKAFKEFSPKRRILHLATHGFFLGDECAPGRSGTRAVGGLVTSGGSPARQSAPAAPNTAIENPLLLSGLALAGANQRAAAALDEDDGILTAEEVAALNLEGVEWAVLSACDTGLGTLSAGEGIFGLRRAFQVAGVRTVIMSLWAVEDGAARQWMEALYRARLIGRMDTADSVREASLSIIRERRARGQSTHPFFWAAFVAAGDWR